ncbi:MAG: putative lipoprotein [Pseudarthrobacter sp.]|nr:putative lipoprotein [Pseudarthrobacter sp.]
MGQRGRKWANVLALVTAVFLAGCGTYPADPSGTLERVAGGTLRVGASENGDWVKFSAASGGGQATRPASPRRDEDVQGTEAELVREFAARLGADIEWVSGTEHVLADLSCLPPPSSWPPGSSAGSPARNTPTASIAPSESRTWWPPSP